MVTHGRKKVKVLYNSIFQSYWRCHGLTIGTPESVSRGARPGLLIVLCIPSKEKYQNSLSFCALETGISFDAMWAT